MPRSAARLIAITATLCALAMPLGSAVQAQTIAGPNPWTYTMTDGTKDGVVINGVPNSLSQIFLVKDPYGAPIFAVGHVGGATVFGDHFRLIGDAGFSTPVFDVDTHGTITLTGTAPKIVIGGQTLTAADIAWIHAHE